MTPKGQLIIEKIEQVICDVMFVTVDQMRSKQRRQEITFARYFVWKLARQMTRESLYQLGLIYNRDHATVLNGIKAINFVIKSNYKEYSIEWNRILNLCNFGKGIMVKNCEVVSVNLVDYVG